MSFEFFTRFEKLKKDVARLPKYLAKIDETKLVEVCREVAANEGRDFRQLFAMELMTTILNNVGLSPIEIYGVLEGIKADLTLSVTLKAKELSELMKNHEKPK